VEVTGFVATVFPEDPEVEGVGTLICMVGLIVLIPKLFP
jgi:hypothetical protein